MRSAQANAHHRKAQEKKRMRRKLLRLNIKKYGDNRPKREREYSKTTLESILRALGGAK